MGYFGGMFHFPDRQKPDPTPRLRKILFAWHTLTMTIDRNPLKMTLS